ncbi:Spy0128 family protein [Tractidigestivibacter montrealensis]|uniref:VWA domain-containing protein n=1 Tax=Tractidigestivibacter montrealensis TaxID=2972466 RepID=A0ABT1ZAN1_9ACTN|nr:FctA domain-containing protein [Tractidigestivibacter montrealensis]MCR9037274.1 VWA domain-containing protein [Tractidigestivibacter montrealensis]
MRHRGKTLLRALLAVFAALIAFGVTPALAAEPPATSKIVTSNDDGTYTLSLSVTGKSQASSSSSKADVIVVLDTSGSMSYSATGGTRLSVAKSAVNSLAEELLSNNTTENPDAVQLSLVTFANYATTRVTNTSSLSTFQNQVNRLTATGGTNWEDALATASAIQTRDGADVYIIFVSDGDPTFRKTRGTYTWGQDRDEFERHYSNGHTYYGTGNSDAYDLNYDYARDQAVAIAGEGKSFFAIGAFGTVSNMQDLAAATGQTGNYYNAADSTALNAAFDNIINTITNNLTYSNVKVTDGITALTATSLEGSADAFTYTKTKDGETSDWLDAPAATYDETNKNVTWDLSSLGSLEHGVTYTVSFKVWPSQEAITEVARLQNAGTTTGLPTDIVYDSTAGTYGIKTNTTANVSYNQTSTTTTNVLPTDAVPQADGTWTSPSTGLTYTQESSGLYVATKSDTGSVALADPDPMTVDTPTITVSKEWVDSLDNAVNRPTGDVSLGVLLDRKQFTTVTLNSDNNYRAQVHVPYGIEANGEVLTAGREVTFSEPTIDSRYELSYESFTPMMVDGVPNYADDGSTTITATNTLKSQVEIAKVATSDDGTYPTDASFDFDVTVTTPDSSGVSYAIGDTKGTLTSGQATTLSLTAGQSILLENLPVGTTYTVDEKTSPAGWIFSSVATGGAGTTSGDTVSGSVDQGNTKYSVTYTNKFTPVESSPTGDGGITINKTLNPTDLTAGQFSFTLTALDGAPAPASTAATNAADGSVSFGNITFSEVGTYEYTLAETNAGADGYTYDTHTYTLVATVTANADTNALEVAWSVKDSTSKDITFNNTYSATGTATISATKTLSGRDMNANEFAFNITDAKGGVVATAQNPAASDGQAATLDFGTLTYSIDQVKQDVASGVAQVGSAANSYVYRYTVSESTADLPTKVTAVQSTFEVTVVIIDNGKGTLSTQVEYPGNATGLSFQNVYDADDARLVISGSKVLDNNGFSGPGDIKDKFTFELKDASGDVIGTAQNDASGSVTFDAITYTAPGTYTYTITESGTVAGVTNDASTKTVTVQVTDDGQGHLVAKKVDSEGAVVQGPDFTFTNTYSAQQTTLTGDTALRATKVLEGRGLKAGEFTFTLTAEETDAPMPEVTTVTNDANGNVVFGDITYTAPGTYRYSITEVQGTEGGVAYDTAARVITVAVTDNGQGKLEASVTGNNPTITNTYTTNEPTVDLTASKVLSGATLQDGQFEFQANIDGIPVDKHNDANGNVSFGSVTYTVDVLAGVDAASDGSRTKTFSYTVKELVPSDAVNGVKDGVTYDQSEWTIVVTVKDDGQGNLTATKSATKTNSDGTTVTKDVPVFNNTYTAKPVILTGDTALTVTKRVTGFNSSEAYSFNLALASGDSAGVSYADSATTATTSASIADGATQAVSFGDVTFSKAGTYTFNVTEAQGSKDGWTYDKSTHAITVNVVDNGKGQLVATVASNNPTFENSYEAAESDGVTITATKVLTGSPLMAGEFSFQLIDADGKVVRETTNAADGSITFDPITYTKPGTYTYNLKEVAGTNAGMAYDSTVHTVTVVATDDGTGQIHASVTSLAPTFNNSYKSGVDDPVMLTAEKVLEGRRLEAGQFSFHLFDENNQPVGEQVTNDVSGSIQFPALRYSQDDFNGIEPDETTGARTKTVTYTAREVAGSAAGYTYSQNVATYTLELVDSHDGKITATLKEAVNTTFTNNYEAQPVTAKSFSATKALEGRGLAEGEFEFQLTAAEGTPMPQATTATNAADGTVAFSPITYHLGDLAGETSKTFTYTISEVANGKAGVTYDQTKHTASVTVTDNGDGTLSVSDPVYDDGSATAPTFTNTYKAAAVTTALPTVTKIVSGDKPDAYPTFTFALEALNGSILPDSAGENGVTTGIINGDGAVSLGSVTFDQAGTYSYKAYEVAGNAEGWTYDNTVYNVTYTVTDDGAGVLGTSTSISTSDGTAADAVTFENVYTAPAPEPEPEPEPAKDPEPAKEEPKKPAIPNTGDATQTALPVGLAVAAAAVLAAAVMVRRRGRRSK